ncbi:MAG: response regulator [Treponema sp.]|nr:response regulator [Treponema sp.]
MIRNLRKFVFRYIFSEELPLYSRIFNLVLVFGIAGCAASAAARIIEGVSALSVMVMAAMMLIIFAAFWLCNKFGIFAVVIRIGLISFCEILLPAIYFTSGGIDSGMTGYFCLGIALNFLLLRGWECFFMSLLNIVVILACYFIGKTWPGAVIPFMRDFQRYVDHIQTVLVSGIFIGFIIKYQARIYEREREKAEAATRAKADFLANVSHEIRTPLNAIIGLGELELGKNLAGDTRENLEKMYNSGMVLLSIINDLLDISKIESGSFTLFPLEYDTASLINDTVHLNMVRIGSKPIVFRLRVDERLPSRLYGDEIRVRQILNNLLSNAFKYTREGSVWLDISTEAIDEKNIRLICRVEDTGIGIKKEDMGKLFSVYNQLDAKSNRHIEGTGLGLSICKNLAELMNGVIGVESEYGKGSVFTVSIPQGVQGGKAIGPAVVKNLEGFRFVTEKRGQYRRNRIFMPYGKVLVVDDVSTNLDVARGMLTPYGLAVDCVSSGREAVNLVREGTVTYDAIFMDHMMPEMDGIEAVRIIRNETEGAYAKTVPIIALTANAIVGNDKLFLENGFQDFLTKPIDMTKLDAILHKWVRNRDKEAAMQAEKIQDEETAAGNTGRGEAETETSSPAFSASPVQGIDWAEGIKRMGNREVSFLRVLGSYAANLPAMLDKLREFSAETLDAYIITVHGIKGASYGICANGIGKEAEALEMAAKNSDIETVLANNGAFIARAEKFAGELAAYLASRG